MNETYEDNEVVSHKEENAARRDADAKDRQMIQQKLSISIDPLDTDDR